MLQALALSLALASTQPAIAKQSLIPKCGKYDGLLGCMLYAHVPDWHVDRFGLYEARKELCFSYQGPFTSDLVCSDNYEEIFKLDCWFDAQDPQFQNETAMTDDNHLLICGEPGTHESRVKPNEISHRCEIHKTRHSTLTDSYENELSSKLFPMCCTCASDDSIWSAYEATPDCRDPCTSNWKWAYDHRNDPPWF